MTEKSHNHERNHAPGATCPVCGGVAHDRSIGKLSVAMLGALFVVNSFILKIVFPDQKFSSELCAVAGALILASPILLLSVRNLGTGKVYMNELVSLAILASFAGGDFRAAGIISFFLLISVIIESRTASGAQRSIADLVKLTPTKANKLVDGGEIEIEVLELLIDDIVRVRPGDNFPIDGEIIRGETTVNQASITGESLPVDKSVGDEVYAGTQNLTGSIDIKVTKLGEDTTLGKVKDMILAAEASKPPIVRIIDQYAAYYTPFVVMIAGITWWVSNGDMNRVITLMVISCPCVTVLAAPSAVVAAVAAAARLGILIRNVSHLELAAKIKAFVFDKTGTLTEGALSVSRLNPVDGVEPAELLKTAASLEAHSKHPTARALCALATEVGVEFDPVDDFSEEHGKGVKGILDGAACLVGRSKWARSQGIEIEDFNESDEDAAHAGMSVVFVAKAGRAIGWVGFKDKLRSESAEVIRELKEIGVARCAMVTGDRDSVAKVIAAGLRVDEYQSECLPEDKVAYVDEVKKHHPVAVVGDGVNDAPALAAGDLGIALGAIGSDIAINSASIALMTNDLRRIPLLVRLSRKLNMIITQNLVMAMVFVLGGMMLSVFGYMSPIAAAVLHTTATLIVIFNSARLVRVGEELTVDEIR